MATRGSQPLFLEAKAGQSMIPIPLRTQCILAHQPSLMFQWAAACEDLVELSWRRMKAETQEATPRYAGLGRLALMQEIILRVMPG